jgi:hypothetical protein
LCLVANDPADMLGVVIAHAVPVPDALIGLCKRCVVAIVKTAMATELISPQEVFGDAPPGPDSGVDTGPSTSPAPSADLLVPEGESDGEGPGEHRPESEMPARGAELTSIQDQPKAKRGVSGDAD